MKAIKIARNKVMPSRSGTGLADTIRRMQPGESIFFDNQRDAHKFICLANTMRYQKKCWSKFARRKLDTGYRVWCLSVGKANIKKIVKSKG